MKKNQWNTKPLTPMQKISERSMEDVRLKTKFRSNSESPETSPENERLAVDDELYGSHLSEDAENDLILSLDMLKMSSPNPKLYTAEELQVANNLIGVSGQTALVESTRNLNNSALVESTRNVRGMLSGLFTLVARLPIYSAQLLQENITEQNMIIVGNRFLTLLKCIFILLKIIISIPGKIGKVTKTIFNEATNISMGMLLLIFVSIIMYGNELTRPTIEFFYGVVEYWSGVDIPGATIDFCHFLKEKTKMYFVLLLTSKAIGKAFSSSATTVANDVVTTAIVRAMGSVQGQEVIAKALTNPSAMAAMTFSLTSVGTLMINNEILPKLTEIQSVVTGTSDRVIYQNHLLVESSQQIKDLLQMIENGEDVTEDRLNELKNLLNENLRTTDLGRMINAKGMSYDNLAIVLNKVAVGVNAVLGTNNKGVFLLKDREDRGGKNTRKRYKSLKKKGKKLKKRKQSTRKAKPRRSKKCINSKK